MKARDIFGIILRTAGLYLCVWGAWNTLAGIKYLPATFYNALSGGGSGPNSLNYFVYGVPALIFGLTILRFAEGLVRFTYREIVPPALDQAKADHDL